MNQECRVPSNTVSFRQEAMGTIFCYEYCNYHSSCQIFHPLLIISFLQRSNGWIYHCWWSRQCEWICSFQGGRGGRDEGRCTLCILASSSLGWQRWYSYKWSPLKCRSSLMLCISLIPQLSFLKTGHLSIASLLPHNSWTLTALFPHYLKLSSELVPNKSSSSIPALCSHMAISEKLVKTHER